MFEIVVLIMFVSLCVMLLILGEKYKSLRRKFDGLETQLDRHSSVLIVNGLMTLKMLQEANENASNQHQ